MKCKEAPLSTRIAMMLLAMAATFFSVFFIVFFSGSKVRKKNETIPSFNPSTSLVPTPIATTAPIIPSTATTEPMRAEPTPEPTIEATKESTLNPNLETCPRPPTKIEDMQWGLKGDAIKGKVIDDDLWEQPVDISHDGNTVIMGAPWGYYGTATVDVLNFISGSWQEEESFSGSGQDGFGQSISLSGDGNTLAIGVEESDEGGTNSGHVEVFQRKEEGSWKPKGNNILGLEAYDYFGSSVSLNKDGNKLAIGASYSDLNGDISGSAQVYQFQHEDWVQMGQVIPGEATDDWFGYAVSLSADGNIVAVGAPLSNENGTSSGSVRVFRYYTGRRTLKTIKPHRNMQSAQEGGQWLQINKKLLGQAEDDYFGNSLSINAKGDTIVVGTWGGNYVKVFHLQDEQWKQLGKTLAISNDGNTIILGADWGYYGTTTVDVLKFIGGSWQEEESFLGSGEDWFGWSISLSGE